jgi:hypothetical protein
VRRNGGSICFAATACIETQLKAISHYYRIGANSEHDIEVFAKRRKIIVPVQAPIH